MGIKFVGAGVDSILLLVDYPVASEDTFEKLVVDTKGDGYLTYREPRHGTAPTGNVVDFTHANSLGALDTEPVASSYSDGTFYYNSTHEKFREKYTDSGGTARWRDYNIQNAVGGTGDVGTYGGEFESDADILNNAIADDQVFYRPISDRLAQVENFVAGTDRALFYHYIKVVNADDLRNARTIIVLAEGDHLPAASKNNLGIIYLDPRTPRAWMVHETPIHEVNAQGTFTNVAEHPNDSSANYLGDFRNQTEVRAVNLTPEVGDWYYDKVSHVIYRYRSFGTGHNYAPANITDVLGDDAIWIGDVDGSTAAVNRISDFDDTKEYYAFFSDRFKLLTNSTYVAGTVEHTVYDYEVISEGGASGITAEDNYTFDTSWTTAEVRATDITVPSDALFALLTFHMSGTHGSVDDFPYSATFLMDCGVWRGFTGIAVDANPTATDNNFFAMDVGGSPAELHIAKVTSGGDEVIGIARSSGNTQITELKVRFVTNVVSVSTDATVVTDATLTGEGSSGDVLKVANPFTDADESRLDGMEPNATADQSDTEIRDAYERNTNRNAFTDLLLGRLNNLDPDTLARLMSPVFTGSPETTTPGVSDDSDRVANTSWVIARITAALMGISDLRISDADLQSDSVTLRLTLTDGTTIDVNLMNLIAGLISEVVAGDGLEGGGTEGSVTVRLANALRTKLNDIDDDATAGAHSDNTLTGTGADDTSPLSVAQPFSDDAKAVTDAFEGFDADDADKIVTLNDTGDPVASLISVVRPKVLIFYGLNQTERLGPRRDLEIGGVQFATRLQFKNTANEHFFGGDSITGVMQAAPDDLTTSNIDLITNVDLVDDVIFRPPVGIWNAKLIAVTDAVGSAGNRIELRKVDESVDDLVIPSTGGFINDNYDLAGDTTPEHQNIGATHRLIYEYLESDGTEDYYFGYGGVPQSDESIAYCLILEML